MAHVEPQNSAACQSLWPQPHRQAGLRNLKVQRINSIRIYILYVFVFYVYIYKFNRTNSYKFQCILQYLCTSLCKFEARRPAYPSNKAAIFGFSSTKKAWLHSAMHRSCLTERCSAAWQNGWKLDLFEFKIVE